MNILIVDDQPAVLASIASAVTQTSLGIDQVFTATSVLLAKRVIEKNSIQILLTDIEMPVENGLSLVSWVRENELPMECILITSHSDFIYAKQAISLDVLEYVVQPAKTEDIIKAIQSAKAKIEKNQLVERRLAVSQFSSVETNRAARRFFETWPDHDQSPENIKELIQKKERLNALGVPCETSDFCVLFITRIDEWNTLPLPAPDLKNHMEAITDEVFSYINGTVTLHYLNEELWVTFLHAPSYGGLGEYLSILRDRFETDLGCVSFIFYIITKFEDIRYAYNYLTGLEELQDHDADSLPVVEIALPNDIINLSLASAHIRSYYEQIDAFVQANISEPVTRMDIARYVHISPDYVSHIVRQVTGSSCKEYLKTEKMKYAKNLLETTDMPVGDIAVKCGFDSFAYFSKLYKSVYGVSPRDDRRKH